MLPQYLWKVKVQICDMLRTRSTFSRSVMVPIGISKLGLMDNIFVHSGVKIHGGYYRNILLSQQLLPMMMSVRVTVRRLHLSTRQHTYTLGTWLCAIFYQSPPTFIPPGLWLPNSTDLNPVNYKTWGDIQQRVHQSQLHSIDELKNHLVDVWHGMDQSITDDAIDGWRKHLRAHIRAKGGHFEQLL